MDIIKTITAIAPYLSSTIVPILTALIRVSRKKERKSTKLLTHYIGIRKSLVASSYPTDKKSIADLDYILASETEKLKNNYQQRANREINVGGVIAVFLIGIFEIGLTFLLVSLTLGMPSSWNIIVRVIIWCVVMVIILFMILFIAVGVKTSLYQEKDHVIKKTNL